MAQIRLTVRAGTDGAAVGAHVGVRLGDDVVRGAEHGADMSCAQSGRSMRREGAGDEGGRCARPVLRVLREPGRDSLGFCAVRAVSWIGGDRPTGRLDPDRVTVAPDASLPVRCRPELLGEVNTVSVTGSLLPAEDPSADWPYPPYASAASGEPQESVELTAMAYHAWANREPGAMRVWLPLATRG
ncbi:hypothetical protein [Streptomyces luteogriseus]|uniref:hypothetical protein n=1 Tax=Streptomyces luteogriseus TaxID=68233 RepID=UPI00380CBD3F